MKLTLEQLQKEIDKYSKPVYGKVENLTKEQKEFIEMCVKGEKRVSVPNMTKIWEKAGFGKISECALRRRVKAYCEQKGIKFP